MPSGLSAMVLISALQVATADFDVGFELDLPCCAHTALLLGRLRKIEISEARRAALMARMSNAWRRGRSGG